MKSKTLLEALRTINDLKESIDQVKADEKIITHFTKSLTALNGILHDQSIHKSIDYKCVCLSDGFVVRTNIPNQLVQMTTSRNNKWIAGISFYKNSFITERKIKLTNYFDIENKLKNKLNTKGILRIHYLVHLSDDHYFVRFASLQCPIEIKKDLYEKLKAGCEGQSERYKSSHIKNTKISCQDLLDLSNGAYLEERLKDDTITVIEGCIFGTTSGNQGPAVIANPNYKLEYKKDYGWITQTYHQSVDTYWKKIKKLQSELAEYGHHLDALKEVKVKDAAVTDDTRVWYMDYKGGYYMVLKKIPEEPKLRTTFLSSPTWKEEWDSYLDKEKKAKKDLDDYTTDWDGRNFVKDNVGGVPILLDDNDVEYLKNTSEACEFEWRSDEDLSFTKADIERLWINKTYKIKKDAEQFFVDCEFVNKNRIGRPISIDIDTIIGNKTAEEDIKQRCKQIQFDSSKNADNSLYELPALIDYLASNRDIKIEFIVPEMRQFWA